MKQELYIRQIKEVVDNQFKLFQGIKIVLILQLCLIALSVTAVIII